MAVPTLVSVSPAAGPPGTAIVCLGAGFDAGAQVGCPLPVVTTWVTATELHATIPAGLAPAQSISVYVVNAHGELSAVLSFYVWPAETTPATYTTIAAVCGEVPVFKRGGQITDAIIQGWMASIGQQINAALLRRGLSLASADWQQVDPGSGMPSAASVLELINRYGAAARLAVVIGTQFSSGDKQWGLADALRKDYDRELKALAAGDYDKLLRPAAATVETDQLAGGGGLAVDDATGPTFTKDKVF